MAPAIALAVLTGVLAGGPFPDGTSFDAVSYTFATGGAFGPRGSLQISASGTVTYSHATAPHTGSGGTITQKTWTVSKEEAAALFRELAAGGLLDLRDADPWAPHTFHLASGRWQLALSADLVPEKAVAVLLEKADPGFWKPGPIREAPAALGGAVLAGALGIQPLPGARTPIDSLSYSFVTAGAFGAGGSLHIAKDGKVSYSHSTAPFTDSGGRITEKSWELAPAERTELFARLVADGLLDGGEHGLMWGDLQVTSGRWRASLKAHKVPANALRHLRPLLEKAHPALWAEKEPRPDPQKPALKEAKPVPEPGVLWQFNYYFAPKAEGDHVLLYLGRGGEVRYQRYGQVAPGVTKTHAQTAWTIPAKEAEALLAALAAGGVCDLEVVPRDMFPVHRIEVGTGPWWSMFHTKPLPDKFKTLILPLMRRADPEFWK